MRRCATRPLFLEDGAWTGLNEFTHQTDIAGPEFSEFRVPNVDTLYSNAWFFLQDEALAVTLPDCGTRYFTLNLLDAHGNATEHQLPDARPGPAPRPPGRA